MSSPTDSSTPLAWLNGRLIPFASAAVPVWDLAVVAGAAVTEMARTYRHRPFRLSAHLQRLQDSCTELGFPLKYSATELAAAAESLVAANAGLISTAADLGIVAFVTAGSNPTYLGTDAAGESTTCIHTFPLPFKLWQPAVQSGVSLTIPQRRQLSTQDLPVSLKVRNRLHWWLADRDARQQEPGSRALLLNAAGNVTETSTACFYAVLDGAVVTPASDVLNSMTRRLVQELAETRGIPFCRRDIPSGELRQATEAFVSSTPSGLIPVRQIQGRRLGTSVPGPICQQLQREWAELTGVDTVSQIIQQSQERDT